MTRTQANLPPGMVPSEFALIHEYYTPTYVALADLDGFDGVVRAFDPSVGIGRLVRAMGPPRCMVTDYRGTLGLVLANPPYGERGDFGAREGRNRSEGKERDDHAVEEERRP